MANGEVHSLPVSAYNKDCQEAFNQVIQIDEGRNRVTYNGVDVGAYYCKDGNGKWVQ